MSTDPDAYRRRLSPACLSDLELDRLVAGEADALPESKRRHLESCTACADRLQARREAFAAFADRMSLPALAADALQRTADRDAPARGGLWRMLAPLAAAAGLLLCVTVWLGTPSERHQNTVRTKGRAAFGVLVKRGGRVFDGRNGGVLYPGDQLRFHASSTRAVEVSIFDLEAAGRAAVFVPEGETHSLRVEPGKRTMLPGAIELDRSLGEEYLVGVFCPERYPLERAARVVESWDRRAGTLQQVLARLGPGCCGQALKIFKEEAAP